MTTQAEQRALRASVGFCVDCKEASEPGHKRCARHLAQHADCVRRSYARRNGRVRPYRCGECGECGHSARSCLHRTLAMAGGAT